MPYGFNNDKSKFDLYSWINGIKNTLLSKPKLLWTNPTPFAQTGFEPTINVSVSNYSFILIVYFIMNEKTSGYEYENNKGTLLIPTAELGNYRVDIRTNFYDRYTSSSHQAIISRVFKLSANKIETYSEDYNVTTGQSSMGVRCIIPYKVFGIE